MWQTALAIFAKFILPTLMRDGLKVAGGALATHGAFATSSNLEMWGGVAVAGLEMAYNAFVRNRPNRLLQRAAEHPDPEVATIVNKAIERAAVGNSQAQV